jgi:spermidine synthase
MRNKKSKEKDKKEQKENKLVARKKLHKIYGLTFVVAFCSIVYELLLAQTISLIAGNAIIWYSLTVGFFLGSLGIGAILNEKIGQENSVKKLFWVEIALAFFGGLAVCSMYFVQLIDMYFLAHGYAKMAFAFILVGSQLMVVVIGILSGFELPMLMNLANRYSKEKRVTNRVLGIDYIGSLFGAVLFPLFFITMFSLVATGFLVAILNAFMALYLVKVFLEKKEQNKKYFIFGVLLMSGLLWGFLKSASIESSFNEKYYYYPQALHNFKGIFLPLKDAPEIESYSSAYQKIDIIEGQSFNAANIVMDAYTDKLTFEPEFPLGKELYLNGDWQFDSGTEEIYHEYFAHVPILATTKVPKNVLVLGGGDGMLTRELLKYEEIEKIVQIDIDPEIVRLAKEHPLFLAMNKNSLANERVDLSVGDAYAFVKDSEEKFDAIYMDFPMVTDYNLSRLYSREFYGFVKNRLNDDGFVAFDAPGITSYIKTEGEVSQILEDKESPWKEYAHTMRAAGFEKVVPFISALEKENQKARDLAREYVKDTYKEQPSEEETEKIIDGIIEGFVSDSQESFILAQKTKKEEIAFHPAKINTYLLNEARFERAFKLEYAPLDKIEWKHVNSVLKPTLPKRNFWQVRFPYYIE